MDGEGGGEEGRAGERDGEAGGNREREMEKE